MFGVEIRLGVEPSLPPHRDVWPLLLAGVSRFFEGHGVPIQKAPDRAGREGGVVPFAQHVG
jgi:hypothetical protein